MLRWPSDSPWVSPDPDKIEAIEDDLQRAVAVLRALAAAEVLSLRLRQIRHETFVQLRERYTLQRLHEELDLDDKRIRDIAAIPPSTDTGNERTLPDRWTKTDLDEEPPEWVKALNVE